MHHNARGETTVFAFVAFLLVLGFWWPHKYVKVGYMFEVSGDGSGFVGGGSVGHRGLISSRTAQRSLALG